MTADMAPHQQPAEATPASKPADMLVSGHGVVERRRRDQANGRRIIGAVLLMLVLGILGWRSINGVAGKQPLTDSGIFSAGGLHLLRGKVLYRDFWDHKPPMVFLLNAAALEAGGENIDSVRVLERVFAATAVVCLFLILWLAWGRLWAAFLGGVIFLALFYRGAVFQGGNLTEEYGSVFVLAGILLAVSARRSNRTRGPIYAALSGCCFSVAFLTKEPFLLSGIAWLGYIAGQRKYGVGQACMRLGAFLVGGAGPILIFIRYLTAHQAMDAWLDAIVYNVVYASAPSEISGGANRLVANVGPAGALVLGSSVTVGVLFTAGVFGLANFSAVKKYDYLPLAAFAAFAAEYVATALSSRHFGHYYLQLVGSTILVATWGAVGLSELRVRKHRVGAIVLGVIMAVGTVVDYPRWSAAAGNVLRPARKTPSSAVATYITKHSGPDETIWITSSSLARYYLAAERVSPTKYFFPAGHLFVDTIRTTGAEMMAQLKHDLHSRPPKFVVVQTDDMRFVRRHGLEAWLVKGYEPLPVFDCDPYTGRQTIQLYRCRTPRRTPGGNG